ncbi:hypothetical protein C1E24_14985 [Pseudoalteromonas phenolica]|uniref:Uncharacterized protein n=1 Tax=Pseudoalteromonas phenolica TaxID=161398 RepID=A0A5R9Q0B9_9GAMM|nr:WYL domain-containing protein [Pseudoalteromonas phenolica]TLX46072.1 hypothetical protein C1E24_14985 [Pseudoalteromonas phenolica]
MTEIAALYENEEVVTQTKAEERKLLIFKYLPGPTDSPISTSEIQHLCEKESGCLESSLRTFERDLKKLHEHREVECIVFQHKKHWRLSSKRAALKRTMTVLEALNFVILKRFAEPLLPMGNSDYMQAIFEQSEEVLKQHGKSSLAAWPTKIHVEKKGMPLEAHELDEQESEPIYKALLEEKLLEIEYSRGMERCDTNLVTTVQPLGLVFRNHTVYLVARYFNDLEKVRLFSVNRIKEAKCLEQGFKYPSKKVFELKDYVEAGHTGFTYGEKVEEIEIIFRDYAKDLIVQYPYHPEMTLESLPDGVRTKAKLIFNYDLESFILGLGEHAEVIKPEWVRKRLAERLKQAACLYEC